MTIEGGSFLLNNDMDHLFYLIKLTSFIMQKNLHDQKGSEHRVIPLM